MSNDVIARKATAIFMAYWPEAKWPPETQDAYAAAFAELGELAPRVAVAMTRRAKFRPAVAEVLEEGANAKLGARQTGLGAWGVLERAIRRFGRYRPPGSGWQFRDPLLRQVVASMGWESLCNSSNEMSDRARFADEYDRLSEAERRRVIATPGLRSDGVSGLPARGQHFQLAGSKERPQPTHAPAQLGALLSKIGNPQ